ncbi:20203_t:CDS:2, partial [Cetraspora pellucida]
MPERELSSDNKQSEIVTNLENLKYMLDICLRKRCKALWFTQADSRKNPLGFM